MRKKTGGVFFKYAVSILLSFLLVALVMSGCSEPEPAPESDESTRLTEEDAAYLTGDYLQFWQNEILPAQGRVSDGSWAFLPHGMGEPMIHTVGSAGAVVLDTDGDGNDEMLHVFLQDNSEMGESYAYSVGVSLVAEVFEKDGNAIYLSDSFILSECVGWMVDSVQVFLSEHDGKTYICMEQICQPVFPDALSVADYVICEYDGSQITLCREVYDPGFSSGKGLYAGRDYIECLFLEEPGFENTGKYDSYELALRSELEPFGISIDYINDTEYSARLSDKTQIFSFESVCSYDYETDVLYGSRVTVAAHTFPDDSLSNPLYAEPDKDPGDAPEIEDQEKTSEPEVEAQTAEYRWFVNPSVTADDINVIRRIRPVYTGAGVFDFDFNTNGMPVYDRVAQVERNGKFGLISYSGLPLSDVMFDDIYVGYDDRYGMETYGNEYMCYTLTSLNELSKLKEEEVFVITGSAPDPFLY